MSVNYCKTILIVLCSDLPGWIGTEGTNLVVKSWSVINELGLIEVLVEELHNFITHLNSDSDIDCTGPSLNSYFLALILEPVSTLSAYSTYDFPGKKLFALVSSNSLTNAIFDKNICNHGVKLYFYTLIKNMLLKLTVNLVTFLSSKVSDRALYKLEVGINGFSTYLADLVFLVNAIYVLVSAKFKINLI